ncbi:MAG: NfeD family protein [Phycicoccus sp.]|nr:NfeD family protein [Phycicoccus sp.]
MEWLSDSPWLAWLGIALILGAIEALTVDFVFLMLAGGAAAGAATAALGGGLVSQVVVAVVVSVALVGVVRPVLRRHFVDGELDHGIGVAGLVGREARVLATVTETEGQVKLAGETWSARTADGAPAIPAGQDVIVLTLQGAIAVVAPAAPRRELPST